MVISSCSHDQTKLFGKDRKGNQRHRCILCGKTWSDKPVNPLGEMRVPIETAKLALRLLTEGMSIRGTERTTRLHRDTICRLVVLFGTACQRFMDEKMRDLKLTHLDLTSSGPT